MREAYLGGAIEIAGWRSQLQDADGITHQVSQFVDQIL